jgi:hypothetical protein
MSSPGPAGSYSLFGAQILLLFYFQVIYITRREIIYHDSNVLRVFPAGVLYYITRARYLSFFFPFLSRLKRIESL